MSLIYTFFDKYDYSYSNVNDGIDLYIPLNVDTEFYNRDLNDSLLRKNPSCTITVQVRGIDNDQGKIYTHSDCTDIAKHDLMVHPFIGYQYLIDKGYDIKYYKKKIINIKELSALPKMFFHLYLHFACADLIRLFYGDYQDDIRQLILNPNNSSNGITQRRRLETYYRGKVKGSRSPNTYHPFCLTNWIVEYQDKTYQVGLRVFDTVAIAGNQSYADLADLVGFDLPYKNLLTKEDKENMINTYLNNDDFDNYALGDLYSYDLLKGFDNQNKHLLQEFLGIPDDEKTTSKLTIGSTIASVLSTKLKSIMITPKLFKDINHFANSDYLRKLSDSRKIMSKVDGGRCFNNRPLVTSVFKDGDYDNIEDLASNLDMLCDIDISGAYGKGLALQDYPIGIPKMFSHQIDKNNKYRTLREILDTGYIANKTVKVKGIRDQLIDGLWIMRVSTIKPLKHPQDLIASWVIDPNKIDNSELGIDGKEINVDYTKEGYSKIFTNEIHYGLITSDILQWIDNICSQSQRKELYDNLVVINAIWYEKDKETTIENVEKCFVEFQDQDESFYDGDILLSSQKNSFYWCRVNLGELLINDMINERNKYDKKTHKKENDFFKLCINTTYGILVSKYFDVSNTVVGNNITARCRCMMYYLEKGLNGFQSITDGCIFELDNVVFPVDGKRLTANNLVKGYQKTIRDRQWKTDKLKINKYFKFKVNDKEYIRIFDPYKFLKNHIDYNEYWLKLLSEDLEEFGKLDFNAYELLETDIYSIENDVLNHLRNLFPNVDILHKVITDNEGKEQKGYYTLEIKCFAKSAFFHGNANYCLEGVKELKNDGLLVSPINKKTGTIQDKIIKMRGYGKESFIFATNEDIETLEDNEDNLFSYLLDDLDDNDDNLEDIVLLGHNIPEMFFDSLKSDFNAVQRQDYFIQYGIIKCKDYKTHYKTFYQHTKLEIGYSNIDVRLLTELVLSQFTYPTLESYERWINNHYKHKSKHGQGYESCFLNDDGTLNYQLMIETIDQRIKDNKTLKLKPIDHPSYKNRLARIDDIKTRLLW